MKRLGWVRWCWICRSSLNPVMKWNWAAIVSEVWMKMLSQLFCHLWSVSLSANMRLTACCIRWATGAFILGAIDRRIWNNVLCLQMGSSVHLTFSRTHYHTVDEWNEMKFTMVMTSLYEFEMEAVECSALSSNTWLSQITVICSETTCTVHVSSPQKLPPGRGYTYWLQ